MKKKVKGLIIAASVVAIAGIAAVSFAYWNAGSGQSMDNVQGGTGNTVSTLGGLTATYQGTNSTEIKEGETHTGWQITDMLVPYDQNGQAVLATPATGENVRYMVFQVENETEDDAGITYQIKGELNGTESNPVGNAKLMYIASAAAPTKAPDSTAGYTNITTTLTAMKGFENNYYVTVILVANGSDAKNVSWNLTFAASEGGVVESDYSMKANGALVANLEAVNPSEGESVVYAAKSVALKANDTLTFDIKDATITTIKGADSSDATKAGQATVSNNVVKVTADGTYDIYFKQKTDDTAWYVWVQYSAPTDDRVACNGGGFLVGQFEGDPTFFWDYGFEMTEGNGQWTITKELKAGDIIKFRDGGTGRGIDVLEGTAEAMACFTDAGSDDNIEVTADGTYTFYLKKTGNAEGKYIWVEMA